MSNIDDIMESPREYIEREAYETIEQASTHQSKLHVEKSEVECSEQGDTAQNGHHLARQHIVRRARSQCTVSQVTSHVTSVSNGSSQIRHQQIIKKTTGDVQVYGPHQQGESHGLVNVVKQKMSNNLEHYSNVLQDIAFPVLFSRKNRERSSSRSRERKGNERKNNNDIDDDFEFVENIELMHLDGFITEGKREVGKGHKFQSLNLKSPTWCDKCGDFIWGVYKSCLRCQHCQYTCHHKCRPQVTLDCASVTEGKNERMSRNQSETSLTEEKGQAMICSNSTVWFFKRTPSKRRWLLDSLKKLTSIATGSPLLEDDADSGYHTGNSTLQGSREKPPPGERTLTREDLRRRIETFNNNQHGLIMSLQQESETFQGFIRVHMNLIRPINMSVSTRPPSIYDLLTNHDSDSEDTVEDAQITSFYLPKDTTKVIHIDSETTAQEVIRALLSKFKITDNPRKFALYIKTTSAKRETRGGMQRLSDDETPLRLCLSWTDEGLVGLDKFVFILQENDTGEIMWDAFSLPELENFLRILGREEDEYCDQLKNKYRLLKIQMSKRLQELAKDRPKESTEQFPPPDKREPVFV